MVEPVVVTIPQETVNDESVRILSWRVASGSSVEKEQLVCEVETSKAVVEIYAPEAGVIQYTVEAGGEVPVGSIICQIIPDVEQATPSALVVAQAAARERSQVGDTDATPEMLPARLTPLARSVATEYGIASEAFPPGTLIRKNDVLRMAGKLPPEVTFSPEISASRGQGENERSASENVPAHGVQVDWQDLPRRKVVEGRILAIGQTRCIQSSVTYSCRVRSLRSRLETIEQSAVGLSALVLFEAARLLNKFPAFSALHDRGRVGHYREVNIGWAIDGGQGLVVPVVLRADQKTFREIVVTMEGHLESYFNSTLAPGDFLGGTFTISDLSSSGAIFFQPLISQGQSAILGIGSRGTGDRGELLYLTLAFDHQVAEGRMAAQFLQELSNRLEGHAEAKVIGRIDNSTSEAMLYCVLCQRGASEIREFKQVLVRSELPPGLICTMCLKGY